MDLIQRSLAIVAAGLMMIGPQAALQAQDASPPALAEYGELPGIEHGVLSQSGRRIAMVSMVAGKRAPVVLEPGTGVISRVAIGDEKVLSLSWIGDERVMVISSKTERLGYGFTTDKAEFYSSLVVKVGPISTFAYTAADGLEMDGILTLPPGPPGREPRGLPAILMPHGGPHNHDIAGFDW